MVEPQENIFRMLEKNMGDLPNIRLVRAAIHPTKKQVSIFSLKMGAQVKSDSPVNPLFFGVV